MKTALRKAMSLLLALMMIFGTAALGYAESDEGECEPPGSFDVWEDEEVPTLNPGNPDRFKCNYFYDVYIPERPPTLPGEKGKLNGDYNEGNYGYNVVDNKAVIVDASVSGDVTVPSLLGGYEVTSIDETAFAQCGYSLTSITIPDGIVSIGRNAFYHCYGLKNVTISDSVTSIANGAFTCCHSLKKIYIPKNVSEIGSNPFADCVSLTEITVDPENKYYTSDENGVLFNKNKTELISYPAGNERTSYTIPAGVKNISFCAFAGCDTLTDVTIPKGITAIPASCFIGCSVLESISIPEGVTTIGADTFWECAALTSITIPDTVTDIGRDAFYGCKNLKEVYYAGSKKQWAAISIEYGNDLLNSATIHYGIHNVNWVVDGKQTAQEVKVGAKITPPANPTKSGYVFKGWSPAVPATMPEKDMTFTAVFEKAVYNVTWVVDSAKTTHKYEVGAKITAPANPTKSGYVFKGWSPAVPATMPEKDMTFTAVFEKIPEKNIYNLGEETYSFYNFGDTDSKGGHCFGMSVTSSAYYTGELDVTEIGVASSDKLYTLSKSSKVKEPICYYQNIQGSRRNKAIVAGARRFKNAHVDINADWTEVLNYVKNHEHDNKGTLQVINYVNSEGGHAMNFLYYSSVNGQDRVYVYDNNFPDVETYFYKDSLGKIRQAPKSTFKGALDSIGIVDVKKYLQNAGDFDFTQVIYANEGEVSISGAEAYVMLETSDGKVKYMYELPENASEVTIIPLVDNAEFTYIDEEYSFGTVSDDTVGLFTLASDDVHGAQNVGLKVVNIGFDIRTPSTTSITYGDSIVLHADVENLPEGAKIVWSADNSNFTYTASADGTTCTVSPSANGDTTFTATVVDANGNEISSDTQAMTSKAGFFQKIIAFFKGLFGLTKIIPEAFKF